MQVVNLQNLGFFHHFEHDVSNAAHVVAHGTVKAADTVAHGVTSAAQKLGPYASWAAKETWHGAQACAANPTCKAAVAKYGEEAVEAGMEAAALQNLGFMSFVHHAEHDVSTAAHTVEHGVVSAAKTIGPYAAWAGHEAWQGASACAANPTCKAAVEKYGEKAVEAAMKKSALQNLGFFSDIGHSITHAADTVAHGTVKAADTVANGTVKAADTVAAAAKKLGPYAEWAGKETWKGAQWCYADATCKAAAEKYGMKAVQAGMMAAALQNLGFMDFVHHAEHDVSTAATTVEHGVVSAAQAVGPYAEWAGKETWKGASACAANPTCKAAVQKYGTEAVEAAMKKGLMQQQMVIILI